MKAVFIARDGRAYATKTAAKNAEHILFETWAGQSEFVGTVKRAAADEFENDLDFSVQSMLETLFFDQIVDTVTADSLGIAVSEDVVDLAACTG